MVDCRPEWYKQYCETLQHWMKGDGKPCNEKSANSWFDHEFSYTPVTLATSMLDPSPHEECTEGIHFFATYEQAINWGYANFGKAAEYMGEA